MSTDAAAAKDDPSNSANNEESAIRKSQRERKPSNRFRDDTDVDDDDNNSKQPSSSKGGDEAKVVAPETSLPISVKAGQDSEDVDDGKRRDGLERQVRVSIRSESELMDDTLFALVPCRPVSCVEITMAGEDQGVDNVQQQEVEDPVVKPPPLKFTPERNRCRFQGCTKYRQSHTGGFCLTHKQFGVTSVEQDVSTNGLPPSTIVQAAMGVTRREGDDVNPTPERNRCRFAGCPKYKQSHTGGYCHSHRHCGIPLVADGAVKIETPPQHGPHVDIKVRIRTKYNICEGYTHAVVDRWVCDRVGQRWGMKNMGDRKDPPENQLGNGEGGELMNGFILSQQHLQQQQQEADVLCIADMDTKPAASSNSINPDDVMEEALRSSDDAYAIQTHTSEEISNKPPPLQDKQHLYTTSPLLTTLPPGISISSTPPKNSRGRSICKVNGCTKLDQSNNHGFCRSHYNLLVNEEHQAEGTAGGPWTCQCGLLVGAKQKRCGVCFRWKGGIRDTYIVNGKKTEGRVVSAPAVEAMPLLEASWTCECGNYVEEHKSRCGKCHHWRGGKRQGGWKLGSKLTVAAEVQDDGIDRTTDWTCCGEVISAQKTRCGKCRGWRGGKRKVRWTYDGGPRVKKAAPSRAIREEGSSVDSSIDWECKKCDNVNQGSKKRCAKCASWRFSRKKFRSSAPYSSSRGRDNSESPSAKTDGHWICEGCSFDNFSSEMKCLMCQKLRPNWQNYSDGISVNGNNEEHEGIFQSNSFVATNNDDAFAVHGRGGGVAAALSVSSIHGFSHSNAAGTGTTSSHIDKSSTNLAAMTNLSHAAHIDCEHLLNSIGPLHDASLNDLGLLHNEGHYTKSQHSHNSLNDNNSSFHVNDTDDHFLDSHVDDSIAFGNHPGVGSNFSNPSFLNANSLHVGGVEFNDGSTGSNYADSYSRYDNLLGGDATATADYVQSNADGVSGFETNTSDESKVTENIVQV